MFLCLLRRAAACTVCVDAAPDCVSGSGLCEAAASCWILHSSAGGRDRYIGEMVALDYRGSVLLLRLMRFLSKNKAGKFTPLHMSKSVNLKSLVIKM